MPFTCAFNGNCEYDVPGEFADIDQCQDRCQSVDNKELRYEILTNIPATAVVVAPSDRVEVIRRITGVNIPIQFTKQVLIFLEEGDLASLANYDELRSYLFQTYGVAGLRNYFYQQADLTSLNAFDRLGIEYDPVEFGKRIIHQQDHNALYGLVVKYPNIEIPLADWLMTVVVDPGIGVIRVLNSHEDTFLELTSDNPYLLFWFIVIHDGNHSLFLYDLLVEGRHANALQRLQTIGLPIPDNLYYALISIRDEETLRWLLNLGLRLNPDLMVSLFQSSQDWLVQVVGYPPF